MNLNQPIPLIIKKKQISASTKFVQQPILKEEDKKYDIFNKFRYVVGKTDIKLSLDNIWDLMILFPAQELPLLHSFDMVQWRILIFLANLAKGLFLLKYLITNFEFLKKNEVDSSLRRNKLF